MKKELFLMVLLLIVVPLSQSVYAQGKKHNIIVTPGCSDKNYKKYNFVIKKLEFKDLLYNDGFSTIKESKYYDDNLIPLHNYKGKLNYHPVFLAQKGLRYVDVYHTTHEVKYLETAEKIANKLLSISLQIKSSAFFPYMFDFPLHGYVEDTMYAPWYSGMAQGQALSLFSRLYEITHDDFFLKVSGKIFNSFSLSHYNIKGEPWVTCVDSNGYLWFEEYPNAPAAYTLNGMIFALLGIYDYYRITEDIEVENMLMGSILTIKDNINKFRVEGGISHYCLRHPAVRSVSYHKVHIRQLKMLYKITGDNYFLEMSKKFISDTKVLVPKGTTSSGTRKKD